MRVRLHVVTARMLQCLVVLVRMHVGIHTVAPLYRHVKLFRDTFLISRSKFLEAPAFMMRAHIRELLADIQVPFCNSATSISEFSCSIMDVGFQQKFTLIAACDCARAYS